MLWDNLVDNECFRINDYNTGGPVSADNTYACNRWKIEGTGTASHVTFTAPNGGAVTDAAMSPGKFLWSVPCMDVAVSASFDPATETRFLRQRRAGFVREADTAIAVRMYYSGTDGASFSVGVQQEYKPAPVCEGLTKLSLMETTFECGAISTDYLILDAFANPTPGASFKLIAVQAFKVSDTNVFLPRVTLRTIAAERQRCNEYALPLIGRGATTTSAGGAVALDYPFPVPMRTAPSGLLVSGATAEWRQLSTGTIFTAASPAISAVTSDTKHARVGLTGFASPSSPATNSLGAINTDFVLLHADY